MVIDWLQRAVPQTQSLYPYVPGKPVEQLLREKGISEAVKLASNENPYGISPKTIAAIQKVAGEVNRYPDGNCTKLRQVLSEALNVQADQIVLGNGSNEVLELLIRTFAGQGDEVVFSQRGFIVYALAAQAAGATAVSVPESDGLSHDLEAMVQAVTEKTKVVCVANPNNPTGTMHSSEALQVFLDQLPRDVLVIIDEAYYEFVADELGDTMHTLKHPGLVISRTFSKAYGLAGLRVGYAVMDQQIAALVNRFREPFNVSLIAQHASIAAVQDQDWVMEHVGKSNQQREILEQALSERELLGGRCYGNFVLLKHANVPALVTFLEDHGVIPRPLAPYGMQEYLRVSVGLEQENQGFLQALDAFLALETSQS